MSGVIVELRAEGLVELAWDQMRSSIEPKGAEVVTPMINRLVVGVAVEPPLTSGLAIKVDIKSLMTTD